MHFRKLPGTCSLLKTSEYRSRHMQHFCPLNMQLSSYHLDACTCTWCVSIGLNLNNGNDIHKLSGSGSSTFPWEHESAVFGEKTASFTVIGSTISYAWVYKSCIRVIFSLIDRLSCCYRK